MQKQIDALDITVLKGGAVAVGTWARENGFFLPPDAPEVLQFYASRSPYFMAARFNAAEAASAASARATARHPPGNPDRRPVGAAADPGPRPRP
jgi:hypothetical protein